jgi:hypothetical protein
MVRTAMLHSTGAHRGPSPPANGVSQMRKYPRAVGSSAGQQGVDLGIGGEAAAVRL